MHDLSARPQSLNFPEKDTPVPGANPSPETLALLARRRSTVAKDLGEPGPSTDQIETLIALAGRVPDHGKLHPWRFIVFQGGARAAAGEVFETRLSALEPAAPPERLALERSRFLRAPVVIEVISDAIENHKIPVWEQVLSAGAVCQTLLIAANAMGFAAQWLTEWYAYDKEVKTALGLYPGERVAGFIYLGTARQDPIERKRAAPGVTWRRG